MNANLAAQGPLLVVTDLMGTTLRADGAVLLAYRTAFAECAIPFTEQELANWRGAPDLAALGPPPAHPFAAQHRGTSADVRNRLSRRPLSRGSLACRASPNTEGVNP